MCYILTRFAGNWRTIHLHLADFTEVFVVTIAEEEPKAKRLGHQSQRDLLLDFAQSQPYLK